MGNMKDWIFRALVVIGGALMLVSWNLPWWTINIEELGPDLVQIRPWGLMVNGRLGSFEILIKGAAMPDWFGPAMFGYLALCMLALLVGLFVRGKSFGIGKFKLNLSQILVGGVGFSYIVAGIVMAVYASMRLVSFYNTPLQGRVYVDLGDMHTYVESSLLPGYYLVYVAGFFLLIVGLLRNKIIGQAKANLAAESQSKGVGTLRHSGV